MPLGLRSALDLTTPTSTFSTPEEFAAQSIRQEQEALAENSSFGRGLSRGLYNLPASLANVAGQVVEPFSTTAAQPMFDWASQQQAAAQGTRLPTDITDTDQIKTLGDAGNYVGGMIGENAPNFLLTAPVGIGAGMALKGTGLGLGARTYLGQAAASMPQNMGEQVSRLRADPAVLAETSATDRLLNSAGHGVVGGALEGIGDALMLGRLAGAGKGVTNTLFKDGIGAASKSALGHVAKAIPEAALTEGIPEALQERSGQLFHEQLNPNRDASKDAHDLKESFFGGWAAGGGHSVVGRAADVGWANGRDGVRAGAEALGRVGDSLQGAMDKLRAPKSLPPALKDSDDQTVYEWDKADDAERNSLGGKLAERMLDDPETPGYLRQKAGEFMERMQAGASDAWQSMTDGITTNDTYTGIKGGIERFAGAVKKTAKEVKFNSEADDATQAAYEVFNEHVSHWDKRFGDTEAKSKLFMAVQAGLESGLDKGLPWHEIIPAFGGDKAKAIAGVEAIRQEMVRHGTIKDYANFAAELDAAMEFGTKSNTDRAALLTKYSPHGRHFTSPDGSPNAKAREYSRTLSEGIAEYDRKSEKDRKDFDAWAKSLLGANHDTVIEAFGGRKQEVQEGVDEDDQSITETEYNGPMFVGQKAKTTIKNGVGAQSPQGGGKGSVVAHGGMWNLGHGNKTTRDSMAKTMALTKRTLIADGFTVQELTPLEYAAAAGVSPAKIASNLKLVKKEADVTDAEARRLLKDSPARMLVTTRENQIGMRADPHEMTAQRIEALGESTVKNTKHKVTDEQAKAIEAAMFAGKGGRAQREGLTAAGFPNASKLEKIPGGGHVVHNNLNHTREGRFTVVMKDGIEHVVSAQELIADMRKGGRVDAGDGTPLVHFNNGIAAILANDQVQEIKTHDVWGRESIQKGGQDKDTSGMSDADKKKEHKARVARKVTGQFGPYFRLLPGLTLGRAHEQSQKGYHTEDAVNEAQALVDRLEKRLIAAEDALSKEEKREADSAADSNETFDVDELAEVVENIETALETAEAALAAAIEAQEMYEGEDKQATAGYEAARPSDIYDTDASDKESRLYEHTGERLIARDNARMSGPAPTLTEGSKAARKELHELKKEATALKKLLAEAQEALEMTPNVKARAEYRKEIQALKASLHRVALRINTVLPEADNWVEAEQGRAPNVPAKVGGVRLNLRSGVSEKDVTGSMNKVLVSIHKAKTMVKGRIATLDIAADYIARAAAAQHDGNTEARDALLLTAQHRLYSALVDELHSLKYVQINEGVPVDKLVISPEMRAMQEMADNPALKALVRTYSEATIEAAQGYTVFVQHEPRAKTATERLGKKPRAGDRVSHRMEFMATLENKSDMELKRDGVYRKARIESMETGELNKTLSDSQKQLLHMMRHENDMAREELRARIAGKKERVTQASRKPVEVGKGVAPTPSAQAALDKLAALQSDLRAATKQLATAKTPAGKKAALAAVAALRKQVKALVPETAATTPVSAQSANGIDPAKPSKLDTAKDRLTKAQAKLDKAQTDGAAEDVVVSLKRMVAMYQTHLDILTNEDLKAGPKELAAAEKADTVRAAADQDAAETEANEARVAEVQQFENTVDEAVAEAKQEATHGEKAFDAVVEAGRDLKEAFNTLAEAFKYGDLDKAELVASLRAALKNFKDAGGEVGEVMKQLVKQVQAAIKGYQDAGRLYKSKAVQAVFAEQPSTAVPPMEKRGDATSAKKDALHAKLVAREAARVAGQFTTGTEYKTYKEGLSDLKGHEIIGYKDADTGLYVVAAMPTQLLNKSRKALLKAAAEMGMDAAAAEAVFRAGLAKNTSGIVSNAALFVTYDLADGNTNVLAAFDGTHAETFLNKKGLLERVPYEEDGEVGETNKLLKVGDKQMIAFLGEAAARIKAMSGKAVLDWNWARGTGANKGRSNTARFNAEGTNTNSSKASGKVLSAAELTELDNGTKAEQIAAKQIRSMPGRSDAWLTEKYAALKPLLDKYVPISSSAEGFQYTPNKRAVGWAILAEANAVEHEMEKRGIPFDSYSDIETLRRYNLKARGSQDNEVRNRDNQQRSRDKERADLDRTVKDWEYRVKEAQEALDHPEWGPSWKTQEAKEATLAAMKKHVAKAQAKLAAYVPHPLWVSDTHEVIPSLKAWREQGSPRFLGDKNKAEGSFATGGAVTQADMDAANEYLAKVLGPQVKATLVKDLGGNSASWERVGTDGVIKIAISATTPQSKAHHEAMHEFFQRLLDANPEAAAVLQRAASSAAVVRQIEQFFHKDANYAAIKAALADPHERVAYMYQLWAAGKLSVGPKTDTWFGKVAAFFRKVSGMIGDSQHAEALMGHFHNGEMSTQSDVARVLSNDPAARAAYLKRVADVGNPLYKAAREMLITAQNELLDSGNKALEGVGRQLSNETGAQDKGISFMSARVMKTNQMTDRMVNLLRVKDASGKMLDDKDIAAAVEGLQTGTKSSDPQIGRLQAGVRKMLDEIYDYMTEKNAAGKPLLRVPKRKDYFPQAWNPVAVAENKPAFIALLVKDGGLTQAEATEVANTLVRNRGATPLSESEYRVGFTPFMAAANKRVLGFKMSPELVKFQRQDIAEILTTYISHAVHRTEYARRFGVDGKGLRDSFKNAVGEAVGPEWAAAQAEAETVLAATIKALKAQHTTNGKLDFEAFHTAMVAAGYPYGETEVKSIATALTPDAMKKYKAFEPQLHRAQRAVMAMEGTLGHDMANWARSAQSGIIVYENMRLLTMSLFSQVIDPLGVLVRGGTAEQAWSTFKRGAMGTWAAWKGTPMQDDMTKLAMQLGIIDAGNFLNSQGQAYSGIFMGDRAKWFNDRLFRFNGVEGFSQGTRVGALAAAISFIKVHSTDATRTAHSERYLKELGLTQADVTLDAKGNLDYHDKKIQEAIFRWVDGAILRPNASMRPSWASDPHYALLFHMKQFTYAFQKVLLERVAHEAKNGNTDPLFAMLVTFVPAMIAADFLRGLVTYGGQEPPWKRNWRAADYLAEGVQRAGLLGVPQLALDVGKWGPGELTGPFGEQVLRSAKNFERAHKKDMHLDEQAARTGSARDQQAADEYNGFTAGGMKNLRMAIPTGEGLKRALLDPVLTGA